MKTYQIKFRHDGSHTWKEGAIVQNLESYLTEFFSDEIVESYKYQLQFGDSEICWHDSETCTSFEATLI